MQTLRKLLARVSAQKRFSIIGITLFGLLFGGIGAYIVFRSFAATTYPPSSGTHHYLYVALEGSVAVYDIDNSFNQVGTISLPQTASRGIRGIGIAPNSHILYISFGGDSGGNGNGSLTAYDLVTQQTLWTQNYAHGIDSFALSTDGSTIYMPDGEISNTGLWHIVNASNGTETGVTLNTNAVGGDYGPHNTAIGVSGNYVYMGDRDLNKSGTAYLYAANTSNNQIKKIGPFSSGIRPFTVDSTDTHAYVSTTGFLGFQVGSVTSGNVLYTVPLQHPSGAACTNGGATDPSHGLSLSPDDKQLYVIDFTCNYVHVFDVSNIANAAPTQIAAIPVHAFDPNQPNCSYDCLGDGWLLHSSDGKYVFVGDSGDVIDTTTQTVVANIPNLYNSRIFIEGDWTNSAPSFTTSRVGVGRGSSSPTPTPTVTLTASPTTITSGSNSTLTWSSTNATACSASNGWSGAEPTSGSMSVSPTTTATYTLNCTGGGGTGSASATVTVSTSSAKPGDCDGDGHVTITDLSILLSHYGTNYPPCDFSNNGTVNIVDLSELLSNYGT
jgi:hypothetical protein